MQIVPIPCLSDNYAYLVVCEATNDAVVVDPSEAAPVLKVIAAHQVNLVGVWNTHHHWDHTGGNEDLLRANSALDVVGFAGDRGRIPGQTTFVAEGDQLRVGESISAKVIHNPGHTSGAISFYDSAHECVFTGDTLFSAGCGRLFEGSPAEMHESLSKLAGLPGTTRVYCGHEYTAANLRFAAVVEPHNVDIQRQADRVDELRRSGTPSVPTTMSDELRTNPFLRVTTDEVIAAVQARESSASSEPTRVFGALRRWKDRFRG